MQGSVKMVLWFEVQECRRHKTSFAGARRSEPHRISDSGVQVGCDDGARLGIVQSDFMVLSGRCLMTSC